MTIKALRILPPFAIGRLGSASEPLDNYTVHDDPEHPLAFRRIERADTLVVDETTGELSLKETSGRLQFHHEGRIRPVAPFLEVFVLDDNDTLEALSLDVLKRHGAQAATISWRVSVANRKVERRTGNANDVVAADTGWFSNHDRQPLKGHCDNFVSPDAFIDFGHARFIKPNAGFPGIRLRFTPAKGFIYGPKPGTEDETDPVIPAARAIYDRSNDWFGFGTNPIENETVPPSLYAIDPPAPSWLNDNIAISRGYLDDACDGIVEVRVSFANGSELNAKARICAGPPALVPDALFVRCLADDLEQVIHGPSVSADEPAEVTHARAQDIVRRAYETVRFMNVVVMNGNDFKGRPSLLLDSMPEEEAADTERAIRPVMSPGTVDTLAIMALHEQVYAALRAGTAPWFLRLLRQPHEVADYTDRGRRKMPALMCGADNSYLALTYRQIDTVRKATGQSLSQTKAAKLGWGELTPRNLSAQINYAAAGNPISSRPETSVANCCPGLEVDFRAVWRRMFKGLVLREYDSLVVDVDSDCDEDKRFLKRHRLLRVVPPGSNGFPVVAEKKGPASSDVEGEIILTSSENPAGLAPLEWSNSLAHVLSAHQGRKVRCDFTKEEAWDLEDVKEPLADALKNCISVEFEVRRFFEADTAVISSALAVPGELTQGLCSPWQNDYRECSCYYWASARPDYVNVEPTASGLSNGDNWLQKTRTGDYVPDDYADTRLILYDDLFRVSPFSTFAHLPEEERPLDWERWLKFQVGGRDAADNPGGTTPEAGT